VPLLAACLLPLVGSWSLPTGSVSRRAAVAAAASFVALPVAPLAAPAAVKGPSRSKAVLQEQLVLILRVQEATGQETRLVSTGKYKELQRLNIKRAVKFMLDNYSLRDRFVTASAFAPLEQQQQATDYAQTAVESLIQILEYFPDKLSANDLTSDQAKFVLAALKSTSKSIDAFLSLMPAEAVAAAKAQIADENDLNDKEYDEIVGEKIINMPARKPKPPPPPPVEAPKAADEAAAAA